MKLLKQNANSILVCLFELLVGVLLLIDPIGFTSGIITAAGVVLLVTGVFLIIRYFQTEPLEAMVSRLLMKGLLLALVGAFCVFRTEWFILTFPILTMLYGAAILAAGMGKVQIAVDMLRLKDPKWFLAAIGAGISILCAAVIVARPFASTMVMWTFTGVSLVVEAVFDAVTLFLTVKR